MMVTALNSFWILQMDHTKVYMRLNLKILSIIIGCVLLVTANVFPSNNVRKNIADCMEWLDEQGMYSGFPVDNAAFQLDNYTDCDIWASDSCYDL